MFQKQTDNNYYLYGNAGTTKEIAMIDDDLAPELTFEEAAKATKKFINDLPDDIIDIDLGSGL